MPNFMKKFSLIFSLLLIFSQVNFAQNENDSVFIYFEKGVEAYAQGDAMGAISLFERTIELMGDGNYGDVPGRSWFLMGDCYRSINDLNMAEECFKKAEKNFREVNSLEVLGYVFKGYGDILLSKGLTVESEKNYLESLNYFNDSTDIVAIGLVLNSLANIYLNQGDNQKAVQFFMEASRYYEAADLEMGRGEVNYGLGLAAANQGNNTEAESYFIKAREHFIKANYRLGEGNVHYGLGVVWMNTGKNEAAIEENIRAIAIFKEFNFILGMGNAYSNLGLLAGNISSFDDAKIYNDSALICFAQLNYIIGEGSVYLNYGALSINTGEHNRAIEYYDKAIELHTKAGYNLGIGKGYQGIATVALNTGDNKKAEEAANKAIEYFELAGFKSGAGNIYELLASMNMNAGNLDKAEELLAKAIKYYRDADFIIGMGNSHYTLGQIAVIKGNYTKAMVENQKAILYYEKSGYLLGLGNVNFILGQISLISEGDIDGVIAYNNNAEKFYIEAKYTLGLGKVAYSKGTLYFIQEKYDEAVEEIKTALKYFSASDYGFFQILGHFALADIYMQQPGKKALALDGLKQAIEQLEKFRSNLVRQEDRTSFYEKFSAYLQFSVVSAISLNEPALAFRYLENIKSRTLNELLTERSVNLASKIEPELLLERNRLEKLITSLKTGMFTHSLDEIEANKQQLKLYEDQLDKLIFEIRTKNPAFAAVEYPKSMEIEKIRELLDDDEVVLQYFLGVENSWLFLNSKDNFEIIPLGATEDSIAQFGSIFLDGLRRNKFDKNIPVADMDIEEEISLDAAKKLYAILIKPVEQKFRKDVKLTIIPDGILNLIPFEVLVDDSLYLIEKHSINYFQSATLMALMRTDLKKEHKSRGFAGFGDPVYDLENFNKGADERGVKIAQRGDRKYEDAVEDEFSRAGLTLFRLRGTGEEINGIADVFRSKGEPVNIKLRKDANEGNAKLEELKNYRYIVFACHGIINPGFQSLALAVEDSLTRTEDGYLTFEEMLNLDWDAELVVLSACQTGTGELKRTEGVVGLTRAVMYAGADAVTVSLWNVSDKGTKELMIGFFENLINKNLTKTEALRQSKLSFIKKGTRPYYWSPFVIYGE